MRPDEPELPFDRPRYPDFPGYVDRSTSFAAAESIAPHVSKLAALVFASLQAQPATCWELEQGLNLSHQTASARVRELFLKGRIQDSGYRRQTGSGRNAIVWQALPAA